MNLGALTAGIAILRQRYTNPDGYHVAAEHDVIYFDATDTPLSSEEVAKLMELGGWTQEDRVRDGEFRAEYYDPAASWAAYV